MTEKTSLQRQYNGFLHTPNLFRKAYHGLDFFDLDTSLLSNTQLPDDFSFPNKIRLGQRMEFFMETALQASNWQLLTKNLQIIEKKQTVGELDFIIYNELQERYLHLEMVYKFYFYDEEDQEGSWPARWIGDNKRDSMQKKLHKIKNKQLPMLQREATLPYLKKLNLQDKIIEQKVFAKGQLYLPYKKQHYQNEFINPSAITGFWFRLNELEAIKDTIAKVHLPYKNNWMVIPQEEGYEWQSIDSCWSKLVWRTEEKISTMLWYKDKAGILKKLFLLPW